MQKKVPMDSRKPIQAYSDKEDDERMEFEQSCIPKYIHYCWFGNSKMPERFAAYISGWKKCFPDYEVIEWNEKNFPIEEYPYAEDALQAGKWAFVSDVARIYALNTMGGIYFDTDVEVLKSIDSLLKNKKAVLGTESAETIGTGFMAMVPHHEIAQKLLDYYKRTPFFDDDGNMNLKPNTHLMAELLASEYGILPSDKITEHDGIVVYPQDYFTAFDEAWGKSLLTENTYCVHHFSASWLSPVEKVKNHLRTIRNRIKILIRNET